MISVIPMYLNNHHLLNSHIVFLTNGIKMLLFTMAKKIEMVSDMQL